MAGHDDNPDPERYEMVSGDAVARILGSEFNGDLWAAMFPLALPLREVAFVAAVDQEMIDRTAGRPATGLGIALLETRHGPVCRFEITLLVDPANPVQMRIAINPAETREHLEELSRQDTTQILFFDAYTGAGLGRRVLPIDETQREALRLILEQTRGITIGPDAWRAIVAAASRFM